MDGPRGGRRKAGSLDRYGRLIGPGAGVLLGAATAFFLAAMPPRILSRLIDMTGLPAGVASGQGPFALGVAVVVGVATWALFLLLDRKPAPRARPLAITQAAAPVLRRADAHPDAPACRPILAGSDLGPPLDQADWRIMAGEGFTPLDTLELTEVLADPADVPPADRADMRIATPIASPPVEPPPAAMSPAIDTPETSPAVEMADPASEARAVPDRSEDAIPDFVSDPVDAAPPTPTEDSSGAGNAAVVSPDDPDGGSPLAGADHARETPVSALPLMKDGVASPPETSAAPPHDATKPSAASDLPVPAIPTGGLSVASQTLPADPPPLVAGMARLETALARKALVLDDAAANVTPLRREIRPVDGSLRDAITAIEQRIAGR